MAGRFNQGRGCAAEPSQAFCQTIMHKCMQTWAPGAGGLPPVRPKAVVALLYAPPGEYKLSTDPSLRRRPPFPPSLGCLSFSVFGYLPMVRPPGPEPHNAAYFFGNMALTRDTRGAYYDSMKRGRRTTVRGKTITTRVTDELHYTISRIAEIENVTVSKCTSDLLLALLPGLQKLYLY